MTTWVYYPHGFGDVVMLTAALREWFYNHGPCDLVVQQPIVDSKMLDACPYVNNLFGLPQELYKQSPVNYVVDPTYLENICRNMLPQKDLAFIWHQSPMTGESKILENFRLMGLRVTNPQTEVFSTPADRAKAKELIRKWVGGKPYGFIQAEARTSMSLPAEFAREWLRKRCGISEIIEVGTTYNPKEVPFGVQVELVRFAAEVIVPDSCFLHVAAALNRPIELVFAPKGASNWDHVRPQHPVEIRHLILSQELPKP